MYARCVCSQQNISNVTRKKSCFIQGNGIRSDDTSDRTNKWWRDTRLEELITLECTAKYLLRITWTSGRIQHGAFVCHVKMFLYAIDCHSEMARL